MDVSLTKLPLTASAMPAALARGNSVLTDTFQKITQSQDYQKRRDQAEEAAAGLVSSALIMPILKQLRRSPFNAKGPFAPGSGEKAFGPEFDMQIADRIAHSPHLGIKEALADRLMKKGSAAANLSQTRQMSGLDVHG